MLNTVFLGLQFGLTKSAYALLDSYVDRPPTCRDIKVIYDTNNIFSLEMLLYPDQ